MVMVMEVLEMLEMERNYLYGEDDQDFANKNFGERCNNAPAGGDREAVPEPQQQARTYLRWWRLYSH